jgi:signal transduction histidine kinase
MAATGARPAAPGAGRPPPSRKAVTADVILAVVLTFLALLAAMKLAGGGQVIHLRPDAPVPPEPPAPPPGPSGPPIPRPPAPPEGLLHHTPWPFTVLTTLPLAARRRYPLLTFWVVVLATQLVRVNATWITVLAYVIAAYSAIAYSRYRAGAIAGLVFAAALAGVTFRHTDPALPGWSGPFFVLLVAGVLASLIRSWQQRLHASQRRFTELQEAQEEATRRAVEVERARIAAELHDVVTHNVSVMVIQTGAARKVMDAEPEMSRQAMLAVEDSGRAALSELRHVMGLLSASDGERPDGLEPQPGLAQLGTLVEGVRAAGIPVSVAVSPPPGPLPPGVDLTAYRVVQEALTNTLKHAAGAAASVVVGYRGDLLEIEVTDTGGTPRVGSGSHPARRRADGHPDAADGRARGHPADHGRRRGRYAGHHLDHLRSRPLRLWRPHRRRQRIPVEGRHPRIPGDRGPPGAFRRRSARAGDHPPPDRALHPPRRGEGHPPP